VSSIKDFADKYQEGTDYFEKLVKSLKPSDLDTKAPGEWSARQIVHHMADSEAQSYARLRRLLAEPEGSVIQGYDEGAWAESKNLGYEDLDIANSITVIEWGGAESARLSEDRLEVTIDRSNEERRVEIKAVGPRWAGFSL